MNRLANLLDEIEELLAEVPERLVTLSSRPLSLAPGGASPVPPLPGGGALVVLCEPADHATVLDGTPHPTSVLRELADLVREGMGERSVPSESRASAMAFLREHRRWIVAHPSGWALVEERLSSVRHHLRVLLGDVEPPVPPSIEAIVEQMRDRIRADPGRYFLTLAEADLVWPGIHARIRKAKERKDFPYEPASGRRFSAEVLRSYAVDRRARTSA